MAKNKRNKKFVEQSVDSELEMIDIENEVPDREGLTDVNDDESFDDAFLDALTSLPDEEAGDEDGEPVVEPEDLDDEDDEPITNSKDDLNEKAENKTSRKKNAKKSHEKSAEDKKDYAGAVSRFFKEYGGVVAIFAMFAVIIIVGIWFARKSGTSNVNLKEPLGPIRALQTAKEDSFIKVTGLDQLKVDNGEAVASIVSWANASVTSAELKDADFETRMLYALSGAYVEILCDDGYVFIDSDFGVLMIVPKTDALMNADKDKDARTVIWFADLWDENLSLRPADLDAGNAMAAVRSADGLGEFLKAAIQSDSTTLISNRNDLVSSYGVNVNAPTEIPAVLTWGEQMGYAVPNWTIFLSGLGDAVHEGASIFNYVLCLDDATPPIQVVDENGDPAGESKQMVLFNLYGVYLLSDGFELPDGMTSVTINDETHDWETEVTEEEWTKLFNDLQAVHGTVLNYSGVDTMDETYQQMIGAEEEGVGENEEGSESETETDSEPVEETVVED